LISIYETGLSASAHTTPKQGPGWPYSLGVADVRRQRQVALERPRMECIHYTTSMITDEDLPRGLLFY